MAYSDTLPGGASDSIPASTTVVQAATGPAPRQVTGNPNDVIVPVAPAIAPVTAPASAANAFAAAKTQPANAEAGGNNAITNTTTNPSGATGPAPAKFGFAAGSGVIGFNALQNNGLQERFAPTAPATAAQLSPAAAGASAGNRMLASGGGIRASREAYLNTAKSVGNQQTHVQAMRSVLAQAMSGLLSDPEAESTTPAPATVGELKAYQT